MRIGTRLLGAFCFTILLCSASIGMADFDISGNAFRDLPEAARAVYVIGFVDGYSNGFRHGRVEVQYQLGIGEGLVTSDRPAGQLLAILEKYLYEHPEEWHLSMSTILQSAFEKAGLLPVIPAIRQAWRKRWEGMTPEQQEEFSKDFLRAFGLEDEMPNEEAR